MVNEILLDILEQNKIRFWVTFNKITDENSGLRLNSQTASAGFIYRHVSETMNRLALFIGIPADVENTTIGKTDEGQGNDIEASRLLAEQCFANLRHYVENTPETAWFDPVDNPFFGTVSRARFFSHILFHNYYHLGQVALTLAKGENNRKQL